MEEALHRWVRKILRGRDDVVQIGYFGSYARGDWGVGSDLDLVIVVEGSEEPFERRSAQWDATELPVPADVLVYSAAEWRSLRPEGRFYQTLMRETNWLYRRGM